MRVCLFGVFVLLSLFPVTDLRADTSNLVIGARAQGMGSAFTAVSDDAHGTFWNPAGLTRLSKSELAYTYWTLSDVSNIGVNFAALATPLEFGALNAAIGFSVVRVGAKLEEGTGVTARTTDISDSRFSISGALELTRYASFGVSINRLQVSAEDESGAGVGIDAGVMVAPWTDQDFRIAASAKNLSADIKNEDLDASWRIGLAWTTWEGRFAVATDLGIRRHINHTEGPSAQLFAGFEFKPVEELALRFGGGSESLLGYGIGVYYNDFSLDYSLSTDNDVLGDSHRVSAAFRFGGKLNAQAEPEAE
jgi:hypothetical protein